MNLDEYPSISLHNVAEAVPAEWNTDGDRLCRVPAEVGAELNESARERVRHPTGSEIRFVPEDDEAEIEITLSAAERARVHVFWGSFQPIAPTEIGPAPETLTVSVPDRLRELTVADGIGRFDPRVCRILFERVPAVALHDVAGDCRPPASGEVPDRRYLAYGTSITEGAKATVAHASYVTRVARNRGYDALNFGCSGSAYCESAMAEYIADRDDWDVATLALSVNMANAEFSTAEFRERAETFVETIADAHPRKPIACVTLFPYFADVTESGDAERAEAFRAALRSIVAGSSHANLSLAEGTDLMGVSGLASDLLHPSDDGMETIGDGLSDHLGEIVD